MRANLLTCLVLALMLGSCNSTNSSGKKMTIKGKAVKGVTTKTAVNKGYVSLVAPGPKKWQKLLFSQGSNIANTVTTAADGTYTFTIEFQWFIELSYEPIFIAVSDSAQTYTLLSEVPADLSKEDADLTVDASPETTMAGLWHCPGGVFQQPTYPCPAGVTCQTTGGAPCYQDPEPSKTTASTVNAIDTAFTAQSLPDPDPTDWGSFSDKLLANATLFGILNDRLKALGYPVITDFTILKTQITAGPLPRIAVPSDDDKNDGTKPAEADLSCGGSQQCSGSTSCGGACSYQACACADGTAFYKTSDGATYQCAAAGNCLSAASAVVARCCAHRAGTIPFPSFDELWSGFRAH